jgi:outer membrane protein
MKKFMKAVIIAAALIVFIAPVAHAATPATIAVVDVQKLISQSKAGQDIEKQLETRKTKFLTELQQQEQKLREDEKALAGKRATLSQEDFAKQAKEFEEKLTKTRGEAQERKKALEEAAAKGVLKLRDEILKVVKGIADTEGYTLVINRQNVVLSSDGIDITDKTLAQLDKNISAIPLEITQ